MNWFLKTIGSTIGKKFIAGITGLGLVGFIVSHLLGNLTLFKSTDALNEYAVKLHSIPGFPLIEMGLLAMFVVHIGVVINLALSNSGARPSKYAVHQSKRVDRKSLAWLSSRLTLVGGLILLTFLVVHIWDFRWQRATLHPHEGEVILGQEIVKRLSEQWRAALYIVGSLVAGFHVYHGIQSAFRSLGFNHKKYTPAIETGGRALAIVLALGFASLPIAIVFGLICGEGESCETATTAAIAPTAPNE